ASCRKPRLRSLSQELCSATSRCVGPRVRGGAADSCDAHLTLQARNPSAQGSETPADLRFLRQRGVAHVPDDVARGVCGDSGARFKAILTCAFFEMSRVRRGRSTCFPQCTAWSLSYASATRFTWGFGQQCVEEERSAATS